MLFVALGLAVHAIGALGTFLSRPQKDVHSPSSAARPH